MEPLLSLQNISIVLQFNIQFLLSSRFEIFSVLTTESSLMIFILYRIYFDSREKRNCIPRTFNEHNSYGCVIVIYRSKHLNARKLHTKSSNWKQIKWENLIKFHYISHFELNKFIKCRETTSYEKWDYGNKKLRHSNTNDLYIHCSQSIITFVDSSWNRIREVDFQSDTLNFAKYKMD